MTAGAMTQAAGSGSRRAEATAWSTREFPTMLPFVVRGAGARAQARVEVASPTSSNLSYTKRREST